MDFYGYMRPNGKAGARNYVLLLPVKLYRSRLGRSESH